MKESIKDNNKNMIYIGDNLEIMNSKSFSIYKNKIKMIYIDIYTTRLIQWDKRECLKKSA